MSYYVKVTLQKQNNQRTGYDDILSTGGEQESIETDISDLGVSSPVHGSVGDIQIKMTRTQKLIENYRKATYFKIKDSEEQYKIITWLENTKKNTLTVFGERLN